MGKPPVPPGQNKKDPTNQDVLDAIAALSEQFDADVPTARIATTQMTSIMQAIASLSTQITTLQQELETMSDTLEQQVEALRVGIATIAADMDVVQTDMTGLANDLSAIGQQLASQGTVPMDVMDAFNAAVAKANDAASSAGNVKAAADALVPPAPPAP